MTFELPMLTRCPTCREIYIRESLASVTYVVRHAWSDGYAECDGTYPAEGTPVVWCHGCQRWHDVDDGVTIAELPWHAAPDTVRSVSLLVPLSREEQRSALSQEWGRDTERILRTQMLWSLNHERRGADPQPPVDAELMENLERLAELVDPEEDPLFAAEVHREMGDFTTAREVLQRCADGTEDSDRRHYLCQIGEAVAKTLIEPIELFFPEEPIDPIGVCRLEELMEQEGLYPRPPIEDVFAFPTDARYRHEDPTMSIRLDTADSEWSGWAAMLDTKATSHIMRFDRLFTTSDWDDYQRAIPEWRSELEWFWSQWSFRVDADGPDGNRYYRTLYQIYHEMFIPESDFGLEPDIEDFKDDFDAYYSGIDSPPGYYRAFWKLYWAQFSGRLDGPLYGAVDLEDEFASLSQEERDLRVSQQQAIDGLEYLERGGGPRWFQGVDQTPMVDRRRCEFVAQIWLDYINAGFSLVYLFYDPESGTVHQVYDYD
jgi:hypothetical protein